MTDSVALIESPFQLLSLQEAVSGALMELPSRVLLRSSMGALPDLVDGELRRRLERRSTQGIIGACGSARKLVLGDPYSGLAQTAMAMAPRLRHVELVDDGAAVLRTALLLGSGREPLVRAHARPNAATRLRAHRCAQRLARFASRENLTIATGLGPYLDRAALAERGVVTREHDFSWTRSVAGDVESGDGTRGHGTGRLVLGAALAVDGYLSSEFYQRWLDETLRPGDTFAAHRRERSEGVDEPAGGDINVVDLGVPVEVWLARSSGFDSVHCLPSTPALTIPRLSAGITVECRAVPDSAFTDKATADFRDLLGRVVELSPGGT